jgi:hypothetical protein
MRVIVYAQDLSGRNDDGYYSKPDISSALDIFFDAGKMDTFIDDEGENPLSREDAEEIFRSFKKLTFYNSDGEKLSFHTTQAPEYKFLNKGPRFLQE